LINCLKCKHLDRENLVSGFYCEAFPYGIPEEIASGKVTHVEPYPCDNGLRFEDRRNRSCRLTHSEAFRETSKLK